MPTTSDRTTQPREGDVATFLAAVENDRRRSDAEAVLALMREVSGHEPRMWGPTMVGFGASRTGPPTARSASGSPSGCPRARPP